MTYYIADGNKLDMFVSFETFENAVEYIKNIKSAHKIDGFTHTYLILQKSRTHLSGTMKTQETQSAAYPDYNVYLSPIYELVQTLKVTYKEYTEIEYIT